MKWLKDFLGINRYAIEWRIKNFSGGFEYAGRSDAARHALRTYALGVMSKRVAGTVAAKMNRIYGPGTHWVVPARSAH